MPRACQTTTQQQGRDTQIYTHKDRPREKTRNAKKQILKFSKHCQRERNRKRARYKEHSSILHPYAKKHEAERDGLPVLQQDVLVLKLLLGQPPEVRPITLQQRHNATHRPTQKMHEEQVADTHREGKAEAERVHSMY